MRKTIAALCAGLAAGCLLCGCLPRVHITVNDTPGAGRSGSTVQPLPTEPQPTDDGADATAARMTYGSVGLLSEPTVLVSVYLNDPAGGHTWNEESIAESRAKLTTAVDWIAAQAADYGVEATFYYDDGTDATDGLRHTYTVSDTLQGGEDGESDEESLDEFDALCETLDTDALHAYYGTENVGFLLFLPIDGCSFTMVHYADDGPYYQQEYSCLYRYDMYSDAATPESPSVYAHEILHMFGAPDLYEGSSDDFVTDELTAYVEEHYPDEIMLDTYEADGSVQYGGISQRITPIVAYRLGLADSCEELALFPALTSPLPGTFAAEDTAPQDGSADPGRFPADLGVAARPAA